MGEVVAVVMDEAVGAAAMADVAADVVADVVTVIVHQLEDSMAGFKTEVGKMAEVALTVNQEVAGMVEMDLTVEGQIVAIKIANLNEGTEIEDEIEIEVDVEGAGVTMNPEIVPVADALVLLVLVLDHDHDHVREKLVLLENGHQNSLLPHPLPDHLHQLQVDLKINSLSPSQHLKV